MNNQDDIKKQVLDLLKRISEKRVYGSVEIFFEDGKITQVTQRIIKKISKKSSTSAPKSKVLEKSDDLMPEFVV